MELLPCGQCVRDWTKLSLLSRTHKIGDRVVYTLLLKLSLLKLSLLSQILQQLAFS